MPASEQFAALKSALAEFKAADAALWKVIREQPAGDAGRAQLEKALAAAVAAGDRLARARGLQ